MKKGDASTMNYLIPTKIMVPPLREGIIKRKTITDKLNNGLVRGSRLFIVTSLAGSGKTTLISHWIKELDLSASWVSLDEGDNNFYRFWEYILASLHSINKKSSIIQPFFQLFEEFNWENMINAIIRDISAINQPMILVLDDYHIIKNKEIHASLEYFLEYMPINLYLVIISREKPPISISRLRANFSITDISFSELRFSKDEIYNLLNNYLNINFKMEEVDGLEKKTEGWIAGIQMAVLTLEALASEERCHFITEFAGEDRLVFDYMAEVVLNKQSQRIQDFFVKTSIMERLNASLCNEVLEISDSQAILEELENSGLFLFALDNRREWFRYHNLLSDFLRRKLANRFSREEIAKLYSAIINWFEGQGIVNESISYAMVSGQYDRASEIIEGNLWSTYYRSETQLVYRWLKELPAIYVESSPLLSAAYANCLLIANTDTIKHSESRILIEYWLINAEQNIERNNSYISTTRESKLIVHYIRKLRIYYELFLESDIDNVINMAKDALRKLPKNELMFRCAILYALGRAYFLSGNINSAINAFESVRHIGKESGDLLNVSAAIEHIADIMYRSGYIIKAADICREGIAYINGLSEGHMVPFSGTIYIVYGKILFELGRIREAEENIKKGIELLNYTDAGLHQQRGFILLAYIYQAYGDRDKVAHTIDEAVCYWIQGNDEVAAHRARLILLTVDSDISLLKDVEQWLKEQKLDFSDRSESPKQDVIHYTAIRVFIDMYRLKLIKPVYEWSHLADYLDRQQEAASSSGYLIWEIEALLLKSRLMYAQGIIDISMQDLEKALSMGEKKGFLWVFINEGQQIIPLLSTALKRRIMPRFIKLLMETFSGLLKVDYESMINYRKGGIIKEPLSKRELEIIKLIAQGSTNKQIAIQLEITIYTVKTHIYHIYDKFNVRNRTQAIAIARELELIT